MGAYGLQSHIWNNNLKSILLLIGFPVLLCLLIYALFLLMVGVGGSGSLATAGAESLDLTLRFWPLAIGAAAIWFAIAWFSHDAMIRAVTGAKGLERRDNPELYNLLENLCIERGITMPRLAIIETPALNAFASGMQDKDYTITVTSGLLDTLDKRELRAVLAHELTHIRNRDVRLLVIAVIFVGIFSFFGEIVFRRMFYIGRRTSGYSSGRNGDSRGGGVIILIAVAIIVIAYLLALAIRFSLSRKREYLADAGAVDLTRDPDAMISALRKISANSQFDAPNDVRQMAVHNSQAFAGIFTTHPPVDKRIEALVDYAGGIGAPAGDPA
ncbi:M48 family metallopeptidase [Aquisalinus flavus]|uniref:Protease HtpX n=1 Tax=Aquisalinus flavus TaxID=1526572 RepID=A0A8J2Y5X8_9PROT|nr:M48 family metallopeptidase [Aquisalinus flavus]MBD0427678.1 M48 family metallopeptidase [Aquisalinus flavus]UNE47460.1 M48 family metallopeptidase [Aquisalinus flavus]GGD02950.1 protease HtpX [Aquisalinus flavus]